MVHHGKILPLALAALALAASPALAADDSSTQSSDDPSAQSSSDPLLAPVSACPGQTDLRASRKRQVRAMVCLHRYAREHAGLAQLHTSKKLRWSARRKAQDLVRCQEFSHSACGRDAFYWFHRVGFTHGSWGAGENLAMGTGELGTARSNMLAWLRSPPHRQILLSPSFRQVGIGMVRGRRRSARYWVAHFGYSH